MTTHITQEHLDLVVKLAYRHAQSYVRRNVMVKPIAMLLQFKQTGSGKPEIEKRSTMPADVLFANADTKALVVPLVKDLFAKADDLDLIAVVAEAWWYSVAGAETKKEKHLPPSQHPDRKECVTIALYGRDFTMMSRGDINRKTKTLEMPQLMKGYYRLEGLLIPEQPTHH